MYPLPRERAALALRNQSFLDFWLASHSINYSHVCDSSGPVAVCCDGFGNCRHGREERDETLQQGWVSQDGVA